MERLYNLQPYLFHEVYTGHTGDGSQVIAHPLSHRNQPTEVLALLFDAEGNFQKLIVRVPSGSQTPDEVLHDLFEELHIVIAPIAVKGFFIEDRAIGIHDLPWDEAYFLEHESEYSQAAQADYRQRIEDWRSSGSFVFQWEEYYDYWYDGDGNVTAT